MPFGVVFAGIVFGILVPVAGVGLLESRALPLRLAGGLLVVFGVSLAVALVRRVRWARWTGALAGVILGMLAAFLVGVRGSVLDIVVFLSAFASAILLIVPRTGDGSAEPARRGKPAWLLASTCAAALLGLAVTGGWAISSLGGPAPSIATPLPAAEVAAPPPAPSREGGSAWVDYATGLSRARSEGVPMLVDFYATWCGPCKMMERRTFKDPSVVRGLGRVVTARVDSEEEESRHGYRGVDLAQEFAIEVYPTLVLVSPDGREIARHTGYTEPRALLSWLDRALAAAPRVVAKNP
jgi:thiol:disulfide interchange protein